MSPTFPTLHPPGTQQQYPPPAYPPPAAAAPPPPSSSSRPLPPHSPHTTTHQTHTHDPSCLRPSHPTPSPFPPSTSVVTVAAAAAAPACLAPSPSAPAAPAAPSTAASLDWLHTHHPGQQQQQQLQQQQQQQQQHLQQQHQGRHSLSPSSAPLPQSRGSSSSSSSRPYSRPRQPDSQRPAPTSTTPALLSHGPGHHHPIDHHSVVAPPPSSSPYWNPAPPTSQQQQPQRDHSSGTLVPPRRVQHRPPPLHLVASHSSPPTSSYPPPSRTTEYLSPSRYTFYPSPETFNPSPSPQQLSDSASPLQSQQNASLHPAYSGNNTFPHPTASPSNTALSISPTEHTHWGAQPDHVANLYPPGQIPIGAAAPQTSTSPETATVPPPATTEVDTLSSVTGQPTGVEATGTADQTHATAADAHAQASLNQSPVHAAAAAWANPTMPYYNSVPGQVDYLAGDYTNINGVIPQLQAEHYVAGAADDYNGVTLSNWAEANAAADANGGVPSLVTDDANGGQVVIPDHHDHDHHAAAQALAISGNGDGEKPKKLVLACHFCRGRKLKCDGGRPTCTHCAKRQLVCTYDEQVRRRGPGKRTKEMRERAAREAEAAGLGLNPESLAHLTGEAGPSTLLEAPKKPGRKRKSEAVDEAEKKARMDQEQAEAQAAVQAAAQAHAAAQLSAHVGLEHALGEHDQPLIDPALAGEGGAVLDLPPLEPGTLGQVIQQLNGAQQ